MEHTENQRTSIWMRIGAVVVIVVAAWVLLKVVIGILSAVALTAAVVLALLGIVWAMTVLRR